MDVRPDHLRLVSRSTVIECDEIITSNETSPFAVVSIEELVHALVVRSTVIVSARSDESGALLTRHSIINRASVEPTVEYTLRLWSECTITEKEWRTRYVRLRTLCCDEIFVACYLKLSKCASVVALFQVSISDAARLKY